LNSTVQEIAEAISFHSTLVVINLHGNIIGVNGAKSLAEMIEVNTVLQSINLSFNRFGYEGVIWIADAIKEK
jgi:Ran GTPase-activating protein (RanGAP) involved in mRNA processing and transport